MAAENWNDPNARSLSSTWTAVDDPDPAGDGSPACDDDFLFMVNGWWEPLDFVIPSTRPGPGSGTWKIETFDGERDPTPTPAAWRGQSSDCLAPVGKWCFGAPA